MLWRPATPPMGWNSWDCYGTTVTEDEVLANARFMVEHLLPFGWDTIVVDIDWSDPAARAHGYTDGANLHIDDHGRVQPDPTRFPSATDGAGFAPLARKVHALGLRFGIHIMRGIPQVAVAANTAVHGTRLRRHRGALGGHRRDLSAHRAESVARARPLGRAPRASARARDDVAHLRRRLGPVGSRRAELRPARPVGTPRRAGRLARRRHAAARAHRNPCRERRAASGPADA